MAMNHDGKIRMTTGYDFMLCVFDIFLYGELFALIAAGVGFSPLWIPIWGAGV